MSITPIIAVDTVQKFSVPISDGKTLYVGGSGEGNYTSIQDAIDDASNGDTVFVYAYSSPYYENVDIKKSINLIGEDRDTTVIDGGGNGNVVRVTADRVNISAFTIRYGSEIKIRLNCNSIGDNTVLNNGGGIHIDYSSSKTVISSNIHGITLSGSSNNNISGNTITDNEGGLCLYKSSNNTIRGNNITNNYVVGIFLWDSSDNNITGNNICSNNYDGIDLQFSSNSNNITGNTITNNEVGLYLEFSSNNTITSNTITNNEHGINLGSSSNYNIIYHNNFINNTQNTYDNRYNIWDDGYPSGGNFWDDYNGTDSDGDGIGDTPYPIPGGDNEDRYPLMYPTCNVPPDKPIIDGPFSGKTEIEYEYIFNSIDLNEDPVMYFIEWGDNKTERTEFGDSGEEITLKHTWNEEGEYTIKAKAKDIHDTESSWSEFEVTIPRNRMSFNSLFQWFLERFPFLERLLSLIRVI